MTLAAWEQETRLGFPVEQEGAVDQRQFFQRYQAFFPDGVLEALFAPGDRRQVEQVALVQWI